MRRRTAVAVPLGRVTTTLAPASGRAGIEAIGTRLAMPASYRKPEARAGRDKDEVPASLSFELSPPAPALAATREPAHTARPHACRHCQRTRRRLRTATAR